MATTRSASFGSGASLVRDRVGCRGFCGIVVLAATVSAAPLKLEAEPLFPDLFPLLPDSVVLTQDTTTDPTKVFYRFPIDIPNVGAGPFEIHDENLPNGTQEVRQRVFDSVGDPTDTLIATFRFAEGQPFGHLFFSGLAQYNLRTVTPGEGVGEVVSSHDKTSFGLVDSNDFDLDLPGAPNDRVYHLASDRPVGVSVGWFDRYGSGLPGQWVDATGLPSGQYWLEVVVDPYDRVLEGPNGNDNNVARVLVDLEIPEPQFPPGDYNRNGTVDTADYTLWKDTVGTFWQDTDGDFNIVVEADGDGNSLVDAADYDLWAANFGATSAVGAVAAASTVVPEPHVLRLLVAAIASVILGGRPSWSRRPFVSAQYAQVALPCRQRNHVVEANNP